VTLAAVLAFQGRLSEADNWPRSSSACRRVRALFAFAHGRSATRRSRPVGFDPRRAPTDSNFNLLAQLGLTDARSTRLNLTVCGTQTIEGAPHLKPSTSPVFDCANKCGKLGKRFIAPRATSA
jgi:hypothetical protein